MVVLPAGRHICQLCRPDADADNHPYSPALQPGRRFIVLFQPERRFRVFQKKTPDKRQILCSSLAIWGGPFYVGAYNNSDTLIIMLN